MPSTPAERKALLFLAGLLCLGVGVRVAGAVRREPPAAEARAALARQIEAVDSARRAGKAAGSRRTKAARGARAAGRPARRPPAVAPDSLTGAVDVDTASAATLERLPRIGPALARRIVEERERNGPYGSLDGLQRVRGIGPALARALAERVTFSRSPRPFRAAIPP